MNNSDMFVFDNFWFAGRLKELSGGRYFCKAEKLNKSSNQEYYEIISDKDWVKIKFHFEIRWTGNKPLDQVSELKIIVHLHAVNRSETKLDKEIQKYFNHYGATAQLPDAEKVIPSDFSTESAAENTLKQIIHIFDSQPFQKWAQKAEECINFLKMRD